MKSLSSSPKGCRQTSLNHKQTRVGPDDVATVVVSAADPGVANWLDTEGRPEGLLTLRCAGGMDA